MDGDFSRSWSNYVRQQLDAHRGGLTNEEVGDLVGVSASGIGNWLGAKNFKKPSADSVIAFHERFGRGSTLPEAMAAAGYGKVEDYDTVTRVKPDISLVDTAELLEEVYGRTKDGDLKVQTTTRKETKRPRFRARPDAQPL
jgi:hypothetical protein